MPLVISKSRAATYVRNKEVLSEILGHSNFDGYDWAVDDRIIFEDGTESRITRVPEEQFFNWGDPTSADLEEVKSAVGAIDAANWEQLFARFDEQSKQKGCLKSVTIILVAMIPAMIAVP